MNHSDDSDLINGIPNLSDDLDVAVHDMPSQHYDSEVHEEEYKDMDLVHIDDADNDVGEDEDEDSMSVVEDGSAAPFYKSKSGIIAIGTALSFGFLGLIMFILSANEATAPHYAQTSQLIEQTQYTGEVDLEEELTKDAAPVIRDSRFSNMDELGLPVALSDIDETQDTISKRASIDTDEIKSLITESISSSIAALSTSIETSMSQLHENQQAAEQENKNRLASLGSRVEEFLGDVKLLSSDVAKNRVSIAKLMEQQDSLAKQLLSKNSPAPIPTGRSRIPGYRVLDSTPDQEMVVASTPNGQLKALYKGESISIQGESIVVQDITNEGRTVLLGSTFFIDKGYTPLTTQNSTENVDGEESGDIVSYSSGKSSLQAQVAHNWLLSAVFKEGFLIKTPKGVFSKIRVGDDIDTLGVVRGLNENGDLIVGNHLIRKNS